MTQRKQSEAEREQEAALRLTEPTTEADEYAAWCEQVLDAALVHRYAPQILPGTEDPSRTLSRAHAEHGLSGGHVAGVLLAIALEDGCDVLSTVQVPGRELLARVPAEIAARHIEPGQEGYALARAHEAALAGSDDLLVLALAALYLART